MRVMDTSEARRWCENRGIIVRMDGDVPTISHSAKSRRVSVDAPPAVARSAALLRALMLVGADNDVETSFEGGLLWFREWTIWSPALDRLGMYIVDALRGNRGQLDAYPAQEFGAGELLQAHAAVLQPVLFQWDAYFVPSSAAYVIFISHESAIEVDASDEDTVDDVLVRLKGGSWTARMDD